MNVKTYSFVKYIATFGSILLFLAPLLGFLQAWKTNVFKSTLALAVTVWVLELVGIIAILVYAFMRDRLKNKSGYVYTKKDDQKLAVSYSMYGLMMVLSFIYVFISCGVLKRAAPVMIAFAPFYVLIFASAIMAAIFESMSRVQEQIFLNNKAEDNSNKKEVSKTGTKRTKEAQSLFDDEYEQREDAYKKQQKAKKQEQLDDAKELEDFFKEDEDERDN